MHRGTRGREPRGARATLPLFDGGVCGRERPVRAAEVAPWRQVRRGLLDDQTFRQCRHLDRPDAARHWGDRGRELHGIRAHVTPRPVGVGHEPGVDDETMPGVQMLRGQHSRAPGRGQHDVDVAHSAQIVALIQLRNGVATLPQQARDPATDEPARQLVEVLLSQASHSSRPMALALDLAIGNVERRRPHGRPAPGAAS